MKMRQPAFSGKSVCVFFVLVKLCALDIVCLLRTTRTENRTGENTPVLPSTQSVCIYVHMYLGEDPSRILFSLN